MNGIKPSEIGELRQVIQNGISRLKSRKDCNSKNGTIRRKKTFRQRNGKSAHSRTMNTEGGVGFEQVR